MELESLNCQQLLNLAMNIGVMIQQKAEQEYAGSEAAGKLVAAGDQIMAGAEGAMQAIEMESGGAEGEGAPEQAAPATPPPPPPAG